MGVGYGDFGLTRGHLTLTPRAGLCSLPVPFIDSRSRLIQLIFIVDRQNDRKSVSGRYINILE